MVQKYADLLANYCLEIRPGDKVFVSTTLLAEPLVRAFYQAALEAGAATVETDLAFREREQLLMQYASDIALRTPPLLSSTAMEHFDCYLSIMAPYNLRTDQSPAPQRKMIRQDALAPQYKRYFERTADRRLKRTLCQWPTDVVAHEAGMSLSEYEHFVFSACKLYENDPKAAWIQQRMQQQAIADHLNASKHIRYVNDHGTDLQFSCEGRTWINSDGQTNMPSGEVYTSPVEDSVQGVIHYTYPCIYQGHEVEGVTLWVRDGFIERWEAVRGKDFLDQIFETPGARRFGEAAVGTNYGITRMTKNILFDEKIGGTVHLAVGQSYLQTGGKNESSVHWDMITDMTRGGAIYADGVRIYENGQFVL